MQEKFDLKADEKDKAKKTSHSRTEGLSVERSDLMEEKQKALNSAKDTLTELFGIEEIPKEVLTATIEIRKKLRQKIETENHLDELDSSFQEKISDLADLIIKNSVKEKIKVEEEINPEDSRNFLLEVLTDYFETYRLAQNAAKFRGHLESSVKKMLSEQEQGKNAFFDEDDKKHELIKRLKEEYGEEFVSEKEWEQLVTFGTMPAISTLPIEKIKLIEQIGIAFSRYMKGDRAKYVGLCAALLVPAFVEGYAPSLLAKALEGEKIDFVQIVLFVMIQSAAIGGSLALDKASRDFFTKNFAKKEGVGAMIAENVSAMPADRTNSVGPEKVRSRIADARVGFEMVYRTVGFDILPSMITLATSAVMLYQRSPLLAVSTAGGTGLVMALDAYADKLTGWWPKKRKAQNTRDKLNKNLDEQMNAHMEIVLSGQKDELEARIEKLLSEERAANANQRFAEVIRYKLSEMYSTLNLLMAGAATAISAGSPSNFIAAMAYSGNFYQGINSILRAKHHLLDAVHNIRVLELLFNGYAEEEKEKEKVRIGLDALPNTDIDIRNLEVSVEGKKLLSVPSAKIKQGSMVNIAGASGAGKTTLMKVLAGYYRPTSGEILLGESQLDNVKRNGEHGLYDSISYLSQFPYIFHDTVKANLLFGVRGKVEDEEIKGVLSEVGLSRRFEDLNENLIGGFGDKGVTSGGETSRLALARTLLKIRKNDSRFVFLDEPTASVDEETRNDIARIIAKEKQSAPNVTFVVISHDANFVNSLNCTMRIKLKNDEPAIAEDI